MSLFLQGCNKFSTQLIPSIEELDLTQAEERLAPIKESTDSHSGRMLVFKSWFPGGMIEDGTNTNKAIQKVNDYQEEEKYKKLDTHLNQLRLNNTDKRQEKQKKASKQRRKEIYNKPFEGKVRLLKNFQALPLELLQMIFSYIEYPYILNCMKVNHFFYEFITGYNRVGLVGVENKPNASFYLPSLPSSNKIKNFKNKLNRLTCKTIPSFVFYRLLVRVKNLPQNFWPYLRGTKIQVVNLRHNNIGGKSQVLMLAKRLHGTEVHTVKLSHNKIKDADALIFAKNLQGTKLRTINLGANKIGNIGAIFFTQNLKGTNVHKINLAWNTIDHRGTAKLAKNLRRTQVCILNLGANKIGDLGAIELTKNLSGTMVHTIDLGANNISNVGAVMLAKNLQKSNVHSIDLGYNSINDAGAIEFAKNLQGTIVHIVNLEGNNLTHKVENLLKREYGHIEWNFI